MIDIGIFLEHISEVPVGMNDESFSASQKPACQQALLYLLQLNIQQPHPPPSHIHPRPTYPTKGPSSTGNCTLNNNA